MNIKNRKRNKFKISKKLLIISIVPICLLIILASLEKIGVTHFFNKPSTIQDNKQKNGSNNRPSDSQKIVEYKINNPNTNNTDIYKTQTSDDITVSTMRDTSGNIIISTQLANYSDGTCNLIIKNGNSTYTQTVPVIFQPNFSICAGFSVPSSAVAPGLWQITLDVLSKGNTNTQTTSMEIQ